MYMIVEASQLLLAAGAAERAVCAVTAVTVTRAMLAPQWQAAMCRATLVAQAGEHDEDAVLLVSILVEVRARLDSVAIDTFDPQLFECLEALDVGLWPYRDAVSMLSASQYEHAARGVIASDRVWWGRYHESDGSEVTLFDALRPARAVIGQA